MNNILLYLCWTQQQLSQWRKQWGGDRDSQQNAAWTCLEHLNNTQTRVDTQKQPRVYLLLIICDCIRVRSARSGNEYAPWLSSCVAFMVVGLKGHAATADPWTRDACPQISNHVKTTWANSGKTSLSHISTVAGTIRSGFKQWIHTCSLWTFVPERSFHSQKRPFRMQRHVA